MPSVPVTSWGKRCRDFNQFTSPSGCLGVDQATTSPSGRARKGIEADRLGMSIACRNDDLRGLGVDYQTI